MAFTGNTLWDTRTGGDDTNNGGGFDPGVSGFPTDGTVDAGTGNTTAPVFSSASYNFVAGDVGAWVFIKSGTNSLPGFYQIASVAANKATLSAAVASAYLINANFQPYARNTAAGIATVGTPTSLTWGIDYSQSTSSRFTFTDLVIGGTTTQFTSAGNPVGKNFIGNVISVTSGTGFTVQRVAIASTSGTTATCDKSLGTGGSTGGNGRLGGCFASPGRMSSVLTVTGQCGFVQGGTIYSVTSTTAGAAAGCFGNTNLTSLQGWTTNRYVGNVAASEAPTIQTNVSTATLVGVNGPLFINLILDGNNQTASKLWGNNSTKLIGCTVKNFNTASGTGGLMVGCLITGCSAVVIGQSGAGLIYVEIYGNTATVASQVTAMNVLTYSNTGASTDGVIIVGTAAYIAAVNNGRDGVQTANNGAINIFANILSQGNGRYGFNSGVSCVVVNLATYNNTSGRSNGAIIADINPTTYTADAFTDSAGNDYSLNNLAGAGAALRAAGLAGLSRTFPRGITSSYADIGAAQHADPPALNLYAVE